MIDNDIGLFLTSKAREWYSGKPRSASDSPVFLLEQNSQGIHYHKQGNQAERWIESRLLDESPCMISRIGSTELEVMLTYFKMNDPRSLLSKITSYVKGEEGCCLSRYAKKNMHLAGIFPASTDTIQQFSQRMLRSIRHIDILGSWLSDDVWIQQQYAPGCIRVPLRDIEPFRSVTPWSAALRGKKVLVVHPFEYSIRKQYLKNRHHLFPNRDVLPDFELKTIKAVQSIAGSSVEFADWSEALDYMCEQVARTDFDVAIIGAGGYGLPLASFIKTQLGKKAIHLGGATQILFGIKGRRWVGDPVFQDLFNPYWTRPDKSERPTGFERVENGCYW